MPRRPGSPRTFRAPTLPIVHLARDHPAAAVRARVRAARALVVATPTYKASYTGLTKLFLDRFDAGELAGLPTVAMMTGGSPAHSLAVAVHLTPVLTEIGCSCPASGLFVWGPSIDDPASTIDEWFAAAEGPLGRALSRSPAASP